jgi:hypothetical protein
MKCEFFVWTDRTRLPSVSDVIARLAESGYACRVRPGDHEAATAAHWTALELETTTERGLEVCTITVSHPSADEIEELRQTYESLPLQVKKAARKFRIVAEADEYGQPTDFHLKVIATLARLTHGVVDDPQENGLMLLEEFEEYMS